MNLDELSFDQRGLIPAIVQDAVSGEVLMLAYMNKEAVKKTLETGKTWFWSRSRNKLWQKGETSGNEQLVEGMFYDCDADSLLVTVNQIGVACHTGERSCFFRALKEGRRKDIFRELYEVILERKKEMPKGSYTAELFKEGVGKILAKVKEESDEVIDATENKETPDLIHETADLLYHLLVLLAYKDVSLEDVIEELKRRRK